MRILISVDIEGMAGVVDWDDSIPGAPDYPQAKRLMTEEANAAVRGALASEPTAEVLVADAHGYLRNLLPEALDRRARLLRGFPRADMMLAGIADGVDAVMLVGYHAKAGSERGVLAHTMNGAVVLDVRMDGRSLGEIGVNVAYAAAHGAVTVLVTGDDVAAAEARDVSPGIHTVEVKQALGGFAASSLHPAEACDRIEAASARALAARDEIQPLRFDGPVELEVDLIRPVMVEPLLAVPGLERNGGRGLRFHAADYKAAYRMLELIVTLSSASRAAL